jgi:hypothetical protein
MSTTPQPQAPAEGTLTLAKVKASLEGLGKSKLLTLATALLWEAHQRKGATPAGQAPAPAQEPQRRITLTGQQIKTALYWAVPDDDPDHLEAEVSIAWSDGVQSDDEEQAREPGYVLWWTDYPEEGCVPLDEVPPGASREFATPQPAQEPAEDAARYRLLRDKSASQWKHPIVVSQKQVGGCIRYLGPLSGAALDAAVDAARQEIDSNAAKLGAP